MAKPELANAPVPMLLRDEPASNVTVVKLVVLKNAFEPMLVTVVGMIMEVKLVAFWNALFPMLLTVDGMDIEVKLDAFRNAFTPILLIEEPSANVTEVKANTGLNAYSPILVTVAGIS